MKNIFLFIGLFALLGILTSINAQERRKAPKEAQVYFISPKNGEIVSNPITIRFGLKGMGVAPAGILKENTGHHHLLIDSDKAPDFKAPIPKDDKHRHFGGGETESTVTLPSGQHTLQLLLGDLNHIPHDPPVMSEKITITVKE